MRCWLYIVQLVLLALTAVLALQSNALNTTTSCTGSETFPYLDRETQSMVDLPCAAYCPPTKSTDRDIYFCYNNCRAFLECLLSAPHNRQLRDIVLTSLQLQQQLRLSNVAKTCLSLNDTFFLHPNHGFTSCRSACSNNRGNEFCSRNCPDYYNYCVKPNSYRTSIDQGTGGVQQPTTAAAGSNPSHATPSTSSRSIINSQAHTRQYKSRAPRPLSLQQRPSRTEAADDFHVDDLSTPSSEEVKSFSTGYSTWFLVIVIGTVVIIGLSVVMLIICLRLHCRQRRLAKKNNNPHFVPANAEILYWIAHPPETDDVAATTQDSSLCAINLTVGSATVQNVNPEYQHLFDPDASGPFNLKPDDELEQN